MQPRFAKLEHVLSVSDSRGRLAVIAISVAFAAWCALLCFLSLLVVSDRDPWTATAASLVPVFLVPVAISRWRWPNHAAVLGLAVLVVSDLLCSWPQLSLRVLFGCAIHFTGWGYLSLGFLLGNCFLQKE